MTLSFEAAVITTLRMILNESLTNKDLDDLLHERTEKFKERYGIKEYDLLEGWIDEYD